MKQHLSLPALLIFTSLFLVFTAPTLAQDSIRNPYKLKIISNVNDYRSSVNKNPNNELVDLARFIPDIQLEIRYATTNNFTHQVIYAQPRAYLRLPAAQALSRVQEMLRGYGYGLKVFDAYRPYEATLKFWEVVKDTLYVAAPQKGSRHNRGCAVDVTIVDLSTGKEVEMPTDYDDFSLKAGTDYIPKSYEALKNRQMLIDAMYLEGFQVLPSEWWHYDYKGWDKYELMDIRFEELEKTK